MVLFLSLKIDFVLANSAGPDELTPYGSSLFVKLPNKGRIKRLWPCAELSLGTTFSELHFQRPVTSITLHYYCRPLHKDE